MVAMQDLTQRVCDKILDVIKNEANKKETLDKIKVVKNSVILYVIKAIHPYIISVVLIMILILCLQGYLVSKLIHVHSEILSMKMLV